MAKKLSVKRILQIIGGITIFLTLPSLLFFGFVYFKYNEDLPEGAQGIKADQLANKMLDALNHDAYDATNYIEWTFRGKNHYKWYKSDKRCEVSWKHFKVVLDLKSTHKSKVYVANQLYEGIEKQKYIDKALAYFSNDSFWLVAPYKVFDSGTERRLVNTEDHKEALLITYTSGGITPGDSYLWHLDSNGKPIAYQMWVDIIPIGGLTATWNDWITTKSGTQLPTKHQLLFFELNMGDIIAK